VDGDVDEVRRLLDEGESVNGVDEHGDSSIMMALEFTHLELVQFLDDMGADLSVANNNGENLLHHSIFGGNVDCLK
jgi:ankyrin repeat protein